MISPTISIIVCCYNAAQTVPRTLDSLRAQTFTDIEILAIDDGSKDGTIAVLQDYAMRDSRLRVLKNPSNLGTASTRQRGLEEARADLVIFFDSDDLADKEMLEILHNTLTSDEKIMGVSCYAEYFNEDKTLGVQKIGATSKEEFFDFYKNRKLYFQSVVTLFRKSAARYSGGFRLDSLFNSEGIRYEDFAEDLDLWCRMSDLGIDGYYFITVPKVLFRYRKPLDSLSTKNLPYMQLKMRWIKDCLRRRRCGMPERNLAEFIASRNLFERLTDWRSDQAACFYKKAGFAYAERNYLSLAFNIALTSLMSPKLIRQKIATQKVIR